MFIFYSGVQEHHDYNALDHAQPGEPDYVKYRNRATASIGIATIRRDGFVSMDAGHQEGSLLTHPFIWPENRALHVNTDVRTGEMTINCLDERGHVLASTASISGSHVDHKVPFIGSSLPEPGTRVQLRFRITNGKLYSFRLSPTSDL